MEVSTALWTCNSPLYCTSTSAAEGFKPPFGKQQVRRGSHSVQDPPLRFYWANKLPCSCVSSTMGRRRRRERTHTHTHTLSHPTLGQQQQQGTKGAVVITSECPVLPPPTGTSVHLCTHAAAAMARRRRCFGRLDPSQSRSCPWWLSGPMDGPNTYRWLTEEGTRRPAVFVTLVRILISCSLYDTFVNVTFVSR